MHTQRLRFCLGLFITVGLGTGILEANDLNICKNSDPVGTVAGMFTFSVNNSKTYSVAVGDCYLIHGTGSGNFTVTEVATPDTILTSITAGPPTRLVSFDLNAHTATVFVQQGAETTVYFTNSPLPKGNQGCTPGYYKQAKHVSSWGVKYTPSQLVSTLFPNAIPSLGAETLLDALQGGGGPDLAGAETILLRAAVAALLNADSASVNYPLTVSQVIDEVNTALGTGDRDTILALASRLDAFNNGPGGCPLN